MKASDFSKSKIAFDYELDYFYNSKFAFYNKCKLRIEISSNKIICCNYSENLTSKLIKTLLMNVTNY